MYKPIVKTIALEDGRTIEIETGKLAKQADGSVVVKQGNTMLLAAVTCAKEAKEDVDFMPLSVEYKEKYASAGRFPGGFMKRESRAGDYEILISRLIDRALRPLFPDDFHAEVFVTVFLISADKDIMPDALAGLAASAALAVSDIPFNGPISECRVARIDGKLVINPTFTELKNADIDIMVGATYDNILMVEGEMSEVSEADMLEAIKYAHEEIKKHCKVQMELTEEVQKQQKREYSHEVNDETLEKLVWDKTYDKVYEVVKSTPAKHERHDKLEELKTSFTEEYAATLPEGEEANLTLIGRYYHDVEKKAVRSLILDEKIRIDGRKTDEIRPIWSEIDYLPAAHGSAVFTRGETQSLTTVTLGTKLDEKMIDEVLIKGTEKFVLHYNFPPFSTGDAKPMRGVGRREVGHGNLAHRALKRMIPEDNAYAIRVVSDILESNGSSSMATVCAGTLALMDSGVKIKKPVSGIAMGLITDTESGKYAVLSDILGDEDHLGDMDFKVTGTLDGITATQMDIKVDGLSYEVLAEALEQARNGRLHILGEMMKTMDAPREDYKPHVPRVEKLSIPKEMIGPLIGPGGKIIQEIQASTGATIVIEEVDNVGMVDIFAVNKDSIDAALARIQAIVQVPEIGKVYKGKVKSIVSFGAFVEIIPNKDGLLHISEIDWRRIQNVEDELKVGDQLEVKLIDIDGKTGNLKLSRKVLLPKPENMEQERSERPPRPERSDRPDRPDRSHGRSDNRHQ
ncbi:MAG: polyribonucleotide nucleotidyltransferase [Bacteroidales bacterium]|nr:polyribonucleotide nucleotidyltransferase [Bacteroidales bacterium]